MMYGSSCDIEMTDSLSFGINEYKGTYLLREGNIGNCDRYFLGANYHFNKEHNNGVAGTTLLQSIVTSASGR